MHLVAKLLVVIFALLFVANFIPGITISGFYSALIAAIILGLINITLKPVLILFTLPINILTLGLFTFIINALLFWFVASFIEGFEVNGFLPALIGATIVSVVSGVGNRLL